MRITERTLWVLSIRELMTATEVRDRVCTSVASQAWPSLATVSSVLNKLVKRGDVLRLKGFGPRGGYGYVRHRRLV